MCNDCFSSELYILNSTSWSLISLQLGIEKSVAIIMEDIASSVGEVTVFLAVSAKNYLCIGMEDIKEAIDPQKVL